jgi:hypothetical protein
MPAGAAALIFGTVLLWQRNKQWSRNLTAFFAGQIPVIFFVVWSLSPQFFGAKMPYDALKELEKHIPAGAAKIMVHRGSMHGAVWTWNRPNDLTLVWSIGEWDYPVAHGFEHRYMTPAQVLQYLHSPQRPECVLLLPQRTYRKFEKEFPQDGKKYLNNQQLLIVYPPVGGK